MDIVDPAFTMYVPTPFSLRISKTGEELPNASPYRKWKKESGPTRVHAFTSSRRPFSSAPIAPHTTTTRGDYIQPVRVNQGNHRTVWSPAIAQYLGKYLGIYTVRTCMYDAKHRCGNVADYIAKRFTAWWGICTVFPIGFEHPQGEHGICAAGCKG